MSSRPRPRAASPPPARSPLEMIGALAKADADLGDAGRLVEIYTMEGLLQIWWFGAPGATDAYNADPTQEKG